jgi:hypothetical protein
MDIITFLLLCSCCDQQQLTKGRGERLKLSLQVESLKSLLNEPLKATVTKPTNLSRACGFTLYIGGYFYNRKPR